MAHEKLSPRLFQLAEGIRYVAVNLGGEIVEMEQHPAHPTFNPHDTDRMEELLVNPVVIELTRRRGNLDLDGLRYVVIRYGLQYQLVLPYRDGHVSIGVERDADVIRVAERVAASLEEQPSQG